MSQMELIYEPDVQTKDMCGLFQIYCEDKFERWNTYMENSTFNKMATIYRAKYGDSVFRELVNYVAKVENISIKDLLADFGTFIRTYY